MSQALEALFSQSAPVLGLAILRSAGLVLTLPWSELLPLRARIALSIVLGIALAGHVNSTQIAWSVSGAVSELLTGLMLGGGLRSVILALQSAGTWIDEQSASSLSAESWLTQADGNSSGSAVIVTWLGAWILLTAPPWGADIAVIEHALGSLTHVPLGTVISPGQILDWGVHLLRSGSDLAIGVALPICLVSALIQGGIAMIGRGLGVGIVPALSPMRAILTCLLLAFSLFSSAERIDHSVQNLDFHQVTEVSR